MRDPASFKVATAAAATAEDAGGADGIALLNSCKAVVQLHSSDGHVVLEHPVIVLNWFMVYRAKDNL
jgi:hypothetical protein